MTHLENLKSSQQDFQWYPTTWEMINVILNRMGDASSFLDIGAGDGRVLNSVHTKYPNTELYAIEKSPIHIDAFIPEISTIGTEFHEQTLVDKDVDVIFCNPPYSEFEVWATRIIKESMCLRLFLVLPERWVNSEEIKDALEKRNTSASIIWSGDFLNAERKARAKVNILKIDLSNRQSYSGKVKTDPFDLWFSEMFPEIKKVDEIKDKPDKDRIKKELITGYSLVDRLVELYRIDMNAMYKAYRNLCEIDPNILRTVGVSADSVKQGLRQKIKTTKNLYWQELFNNLDRIYKRLTAKNRDIFLQKINSKVYVDFTSENAFAVIMWILKNANTYIDSQVVDVFKGLTSPQNIQNYKSNKKTWENNRWRFNEQNPSHYILDYRIVLEGWKAIYRSSDFYSFEYKNNLHEGAHAKIMDIITVSNNLGFACSESSYTKEWASNKAHKFYMDNGTLLFEVRAFMNGNVHFKFNKKFIKTLNVEASRLLKWVKTPQEACEEMGYSLSDVISCFKTNNVFQKSDCKLLCSGN
jgi:hypothetical protein